ncbi:HAF repeat-containing protein [Geotalea toluenoxydans]|uniref:HAF repeat-containing protein n=1 Tax=Geotalea toluenoxydans TaxID=421624 RepID=UPI0006D191E1|nr:HAF repeat-containing protein [Geotalea toluenoxydans]
MVVTKEVGNCSVFMFSGYSKMKGMFKKVVPQTLLSLTMLSFLSFNAVCWAGDGGDEVTASSGIKGITITDLGTLGGDRSAAGGINEKGQVMGRSSTSSGEPHCFFWENGVMTDLGTLGGGDYCEPRAINNKGQVVGTSVTSSGALHGFIWQDGVMTDLGTRRWV